MPSTASTHNHQHTRQLAEKTVHQFPSEHIGFLRRCTCEPANHALSDKFVTFQRISFMPAAPVYMARNLIPASEDHPTVRL